MPWLVTTACCLILFTGDPSYGHVGSSNCAPIYIQGFQLFLLIRLTPSRSPPSPPPRSPFYHSSQPGPKVGISRDPLGHMYCLSLPRYTWLPAHFSPAMVDRPNCGGEEIHQIILHVSKHGFSLSVSLPARYLKISSMPASLYWNFQIFTYPCANICQSLCQRLQTSVTIEISRRWPPWLSLRYSNFYYYRDLQPASLRIFRV